MDSESENEDDNGAGRPTSDLGRSKAGPEFIPFYERRSNSRGLRPPSELWLVSYSDFMTIMAIFFLVMYGYTYLKAAALLKKQNAQITYSAFADMISKIQQNAGQKMDIQNDTDKVVIQMKDDILFDSGKTELSSGAQSTLAELANSLKLVDGDIVVQGHSDNVPIAKGRYQTNWELSAARAFSVVEALSGNGIEPERLSAWGFGENRPLVSNDTAEERAKNRRIEVVVLKKKTS